MAKHYKNHLSGFYDWKQLEHSSEWILYPDNIGERLCLYEIALSDGELYTVLTNAGAKSQKGSLIAMVKGVKSGEVCDVLNKIPMKNRKKVKEISVDMANNMEKPLYKTKGHQFLDELNGIFAFAIFVTTQVKSFWFKKSLFSTYCSYFFHRFGLAEMLSKNIFICQKNCFLSETS